MTTRASRLRRGFTLIEMIIVIALISILVSIAIPVYRQHLLHAKEAVLKEDLYSMRNAIDQYVQDKGKAPQDLNDLVTAGYLRLLPKDPFTESNSTWQPVQEDVLTSVDQTEPGISDVHSGSSATGSDGTAYNTW
jgi:general secretion pathway protein G